MRSKASALAGATPWVASQSNMAADSGQTMVWPRQRLRMVGKSWCAASLASTKRTSPGGSSSVFSSALAVMVFICSAGYTSTALPRPRALVRWANSTASRMASTRISRLGLRFLSSISAWAFSGRGQPRASSSVSGMSTHRSAWVCTSMAWQLAQWPQAPWALVDSHSQARTSSSASANCPSPEGPCKSQAWPRWASKALRCAASQGASAGAAGTNVGAVALAVMARVPAGA